MESLSWILDVKTLESGMARASELRARALVWTKKAVENPDDPASLVMLLMAAEHIREAKRLEGSSEGAVPAHR